MERWKIFNPKICKWINEINPQMDRWIDYKKINSKIDREIMEKDYLTSRKIDRWKRINPQE